MSNSKLVSYTKISPFAGNYDSNNKFIGRKRLHKIDTISIHCTDGQSTVEGLGITFQNNYASCNYAIGRDGKIALIVDESERSWCTSDDKNDNRAITIECASDNFHPYKVNDKVYNALIELLVDICKRNGIKKLLWKGDKSLIGQVDKQNMTVHRWFANKPCPGEYLYSRHGQIADEVNQKLSEKNTAENLDNIYRVQVGAFKSTYNAEKLRKNLKSKGFNGFIIQGKDNLYHVQVGAFKDKSNAKLYEDKLYSNGFESYII